MNQFFAKRSVLCSALLVGLIFIGTSAVRAQSASRKVIKKVEPVYPTVLLERKIGGTVRLTVTVRADGTVRQVEVEGGNPILAASAARAVKFWRYSAGDRETTTQVVVHFDPDK